MRSLLEAGAVTNRKLIRIKLDNNRSYMVAIDPDRFDRSELTDAEDNSIVIRGSRTEINGRSVVKATSIRIDGETLRQAMSN